MRLSRTTTFLLTGLLTAGLVLPVLSQTKDGQKNSKKISADDIKKQQESLVKDYKDFEENLLRLAEHVKETDPAKAQMIRDALKKSSSARIEDRMKAVARLLASDELGNASESQKELIASLKNHHALYPADKEHGGRPLEPKLP